MLCQICDETYNKSKNIKITCPYCNFDACRKCCETYVLSEPLPKCMNTSCDKTWTRKFIVDVFTKTFITKSLKSHREQILFDQERALLPATQVVVEEQIRFETYVRKLREIDDRIAQLKREKNDLIEDFRNHSTEQISSATTRRQFVRACPEPECRGFLSTQWKCGLCEKWTCPDCHVVKGIAPHICNPDDVATAQLLANDTKSCPKCATGIFKIDGCDQMWCTQCHTAFSWRTGMIENRIHNPHYYEWLIRNGDVENPNQYRNQCENNEPAIGHVLSANIIRELRNKIKDDDVKQKELCKKTSKIIESIAHLRGDVMQRYRNDYRVLNNEELRIKYMRNFIDEQCFKTRLQRDNKKYEKKREISEILEMFITTSSDIMRRYYRELRNCKTAEEIFKITILQEIDRIVEYANECLAVTCNVYDSVKLCIVLRGTTEKEDRFNPVLCVKT